VRKEFEGTLQMNPVTDRLEPSFHFRERLIRYLRSFLICLPYFFVVVVFNIIFLNLTGVIDPLRHHALFQIEPLSILCQPGAIFDPNSNAALIPTAVQCIISVLLDLRFKVVASQATEVENHRTMTQFNDSLIIKRFLFMFCDYFLYLFYIGLYELRLDLLKTNLAFLFMIDEVRRITIETVLPAVQLWQDKRSKRALKRQGQMGG
jgi:hypothetical protein